MNIITGFEPSRIICKEKGMSSIDDVLDSTRHSEFYKEDLKMVKEMGINILRVAVPWHKIEKERRIYDWEWMDGYMEELQKLDIEPIMDPLHHTSFPSWLGGMNDSQFVSTYRDFFIRCVERYSWVEKWTIVNEPFVTGLFCSNGLWYPFKDDCHSTTMNNLVIIITSLSLHLHFLGKKHVYVDASEVHRSRDEQSDSFAHFKNEHRFSIIDRVLAAGGKIDILGLDYYAHCEFEWSVNGREPNDNPVGFAVVARQYYDRYKIPIMLTETNIRGFIEDRQHWFVYMYKECLKLNDIPFLGMCWYPFIDSTDWDSLITQPNGNIDPQGIIWLDEAKRRHTSMFSENIKKLISGEINIDDVVVEPYKEPLATQLRGFIELEKKG